MSDFPGKSHVVPPPSEPRPTKPIPSPGNPTTYVHVDGCPGNHDASRSPCPLRREQWHFHDPSGAGFCPRCKFPIEVHPLDPAGVDIESCPDQPFVMHTYAYGCAYDLCDPNGRPVANPGDHLGCSGCESKGLRLKELERSSTSWECGATKDGSQCARPAGHKGMHRKSLPTISDIRGMAPGMTGGLPAEVWVRMIRDEELDDSGEAQRLVDKTVLDSERGRVTIQSLPSVQPNDTDEGGS